MADPTSTASIALNRFGLGARPDEAPPADPRGWLREQLTRYVARPALIAAAPASPAISRDLAEYTAERRAQRAQRAPQGAGAAPMSASDRPAPGMRNPGMRNPGMRNPAMRAPAMAAGEPGAPPGPGDPAPAARTMPGRDAARLPLGGQGRRYYADLVGATFNQALVTDTPFADRLVRFWANHFAVSADSVTVVGLAGTLETEVIRPRLTGSFHAMLTAVEHHPAMLFYLNQNQSVGPNSTIGARAARIGVRKVGLNENLGREIMELHTLGVRSGYSQGDVTEFARALTGWTVAGIGGRARLAATGAAAGAFLFDDMTHEPGDRTIMGKRYPAGGEAQAQAVLADLAAHPATATHIATKLASHFAGDPAPPAMVERLKAAFLRSQGDLPTVYRAIIDSPEAWVQTPVKFRTPWDWAVATQRALGVRQADPLVTVGLMSQLGQPVWRPGNPSGYDDSSATWAAPDAVMRRVEAAERFASRAPEIDARALAPKLFPASVSAATAQALQRAESPGQALALLLVAPEMMRR